MKEIDRETVRGGKHPWIYWSVTSLWFIILQDAYSFDPRYKEIWDDDWRETDDFFYDNPEIASKYGIVTCLDGEPAGFVVWDPRNRPDYVEIGHNGIRERYKILWLQRITNRQDLC